MAGTSIFRRWAVIVLCAASLSVAMPMPGEHTGSHDGLRHFPAAEAASDVGSETGLALPRFVTLRSNEVNLRTGPGTRYPVEWVFVRSALPVEVIAEFDTWRKIRDFSGVEGWVHQAMLSGNRSVVVMQERRTLRREPSESAAAVALADPGVIGALRRCQGSWCEISAAGYTGWLHRSEIWGVYENETIR